ncbi:MAG: excinuclease ABC subunit UvrA, partial [Firmicutes bacterium]|nr:excinuclease ABC subunit UvrA [Bacillota bacterium]
FNSPYGACPECTGIGTRMELDPGLVIPDPSKSVAEGAIAPWGKPLRDFRHHAAESWYWEKLKDVAHHYKINLHIPFKDLTKHQQKILLYGTDHGGADLDVEFEGAVPNLQRRYLDTSSEYIRWEIEKYMANTPCPA